MCRARFAEGEAVKLEQVDGRSKLTEAREERKPSTDPTDEPLSLITVQTAILGMIESYESRQHVTVCSACRLTEQQGAGGDLCPPPRAPTTSTSITAAQTAMKDFIADCGNACFYIASICNLSLSFYSL